MGKRSTQEELNRRVGEVSNLLITGQKRHQIVAHATENGWDVEERQIDTYIKKAKKLLSEEGRESKSDRDILFAISLRRLNLLFVKCMAIQDYQRALQAQKEINTLLALYEPQTKHVKVETWEDQAIEYIKNGEIGYTELVEEFDSDLATRLFQLAGVEITEG
jgi:hypothetical protein